MHSENYAPNVAPTSHAGPPSNITQCRTQTRNPRRLTPARRKIVPAIRGTEFALEFNGINPGRVVLELRKLPLSTLMLSC
jgi:hypothetical protein